MVALDQVSRAFAKGAGHFAEAEVAGTEQLVLAHWQAAGQLPPPDLTVALALDDDGHRRVTLVAGSAAGRALLEAA